MMQAPATCYNVVAGYPQMRQKMMIRMAAALACAADHDSDFRRQMMWFIHSLAAVTVNVISDGLP